MRKLFFLFFCLMTILSVDVNAAGKKKVHTIGDSTMQTYADTDTKRGWGQMLQQFFNADNITVNNRGKSGASSKSFYKEAAYWPTLVTGGSNQMQAGDILVIQFAHNDEKSSGTDGDEENALGGAQVDYRGTTPFDTYKKYLRAYIDEAKKMGVKPILCGPICRKYFSGNTIRRNGRHDLGDNFNKIVDGKVTTGNKIAANDHTMDYVWQMQQVALEYDDVPFIDLTTATADMYISYGEAYCTSNIFCPDDGTHPGAMGATLIARLFATLVHNQANGGETDTKRAAVLKELDADIVLSSEISFSPVSGDMGKTYSGQSLVKNFNVSAFGLTPAEGTVTLSVDGAYSISLDKQNYGKSVEVKYDGSTLITTVYVKVTGTGSGNVTGTLTATNGTVTNTLPLTTQVVSLSGGEEVSVVWPLTTDDQAVVTGPITAIGESWEGMKVANYNAINAAAIWPEGSGYDATRKTQRNGTLDGNWPAGEIDEVSTRYIQFAVQAPEETDIAVDQISMYVAGAGGSGMRCKVYYSTASDFSDPQQIYSNVSMAGNTAYYVEAKPTFSISEGERLYIRIYPWYSSAASGKTICLSDVTVHGYATKAGGQEVKIEGAINYGLHAGGLDQAPEFNPAEMGAGIVGKTMTAGKALTIDGTVGWTGSDSPITMTKVYNGTEGSWATTATDDNTLTFTITPEDGFFFLPSKVSFNAARFGTDGGNISAAIEAGSANVEICNNEGVNRGAKSLPVKNISAEIAGVVASAADPLKLKISFLGLGMTKTMGISDLVIEGTLQGTASSSVKYILNTNVSPAGAGTISLDPELASYKEGSKVKLTAKKNFGYKFKEWKDAEGNTVSTDAETTVTMDAEKTMTAVFESVPVYTVSTSCTNDADRSLGSITLTPDEHAGKYEAGTEITAVANESKIVKFMQWTDANENAGTSATRKLTVNSDMTLVANYEVQDFVAVFDASAVNTYAYETTGNYPFPADLAWDANRNATAQVVRLSDGQKVWTKDGGTPVVRNREGVVMTGINGLYQNGFDTRQIAFQYQFSTKDFTSVTFTGDMAAKNMANKDWKVQVSTDGATFTDLASEGASWSMTANVKKNVSFTLPESLCGQDLVTLRICGVGDELLSSSYSVEGKWLDVDYYSHSESGIGNVYVLGEAAVIADEVAPVVTGTIPANGATGVSATGNITISYDERIQAGSVVGATATLNGETLAAKWNSRSVSFQYVNLEYGKTYTFSMPKGYVEDKSGNAADAVELSFTVMDRQKPQARTFNAIVDATLTVDKIAATADMPAQYRYIQEAINDAPDSNDKPYLIYIKEGYYKDSNKTFKDSYGTIVVNGVETRIETGGISEYDPNCYIINVNKPNIHLIGQAVDKVTIASDRLDGKLNDGSRPWYHINAGATLEVQAKGTDFYMENITLDNENWTKLGLAGPQALSANVSADRAAFNNCNIRSYQDTYYNGGDLNRTFINNTTIEGAVDFIYGSSDIWFEGCTLNINRDKGGYIVAPNHSENVRWGYVFNNTKITSTYTSDPSKFQIYLGRPWHNQPLTVFLHTQMELTPYAGYWYETMGGIPKLWAVYDIWDKNGNKLSEESIDYYHYTDKEKGEISGKSKNYLTADEVAQYTISNVMAGDGTANPQTGMWNPLPIVEKTAKPVLSQTAGVVTWQADDYAICYVVTVNGKPVAFPTETSYAANNGDVITVQSVNEYGALSEMSEAITVDNTADGITEIHSGAMQNANGRYNIAGQRINKYGHNGIFIENGKKFVK